MPDVKVRTPGGGTVTVRAPEGASQEDILAFAEQQYNSQKEGFMQYFGRGLAKSVKSTFASGGSAEPQGPYEPTEQFEERRGLLPAVEEQYPEPKTLKGRIAQGAGEGIASPQNMLGPLAGLGKRAVIGAVSGIGSELAGMVSKDNPLARIIGGVAGGVAGGKVANVGARGTRAVAEAAQPSVPPERIESVRELQSRGVQPSAGDALGSETIKHLEKLGDWWFGGASYKKLKLQTLGEFTNAALQGIGATGTRLTSDMIRGVQTRFDRSAQSLAKRLSITQYKGMSNDIAKINQDAFRYGSDTATKVIHNLSEDINNGFVTTADPKKNYMEWRKYQSLTNHRSPLARAMRSTDGDIRYYAGRLRTALDDAMDATVQAEVQKIKTTDPTTQFRRGQAGLPARQRAIDIAEAYEEFKTRRREWYNMIVLSKSVATGGEAAAEGLILPEKLRAALTDSQDNKVAYAARRSSLQALAKAGVNIIEPYERPTGWRAAIAPLVTVGGLVSTPITGAAGVKSAGIASLPGLLGRAVNSPRVQDYLRGERMRNLTDQLITWKEAAARGGLVGATSQTPQPGQQRMATPVSPMMLNRARAQARGDESETAGLPALSRRDASIGMTAGAGGPGASRRVGAKIIELLQQGKTYSEIGDALGLTRNAVAGQIRDLKIGGYSSAFRRPARLTDAQARARENPQGKVNPASDEERLRRLKQTRRPLTDAEKEDRAELERRPLRVTVHPRSSYGGSEE